MSVRYFIRRDIESGGVLELARVHQEPGRMWGEFWQDGAWHPSQRVTTYTFEPLEADEIPEAEALRIVGELTTRRSGASQ